MHGYNWPIHCTQTIRRDEDAAALKLKNDARAAEDAKNAAVSASMAALRASLQVRG